jgi:hypothetical protein
VWHWLRFVSLALGFHQLTFGRAADMAELNKGVIREKVNRELILFLGWGFPLAEDCYIVSS